MRVKQKDRKPAGPQHRAYLQTVDRDGRPMQSHTEQLLAGRIKLHKELAHEGRKQPGSHHSQTRRFNPRAPDTKGKGSNE